MARITRRIHTRGYELDARHRIPPAILARYFEHVRWAAMFEPSAGLGPLLTDGRKLVVRAQELLVERPLSLDEELELSVQLAQVGRTSLKLAHELVRVASGERVAQCVITAVELDAQGRPTQVPEAVAAYATGATVPASRPPFDEPAQGVWTCPWQVRPSDLDGLGHMNQSRYVELVDDVRALCVGAGGYGAERERARGYPRRIAVDYRRETKLGTDLVVRTWAAAEGVLSFRICDATSGAVHASATIDLA